MCEVILLDYQHAKSACCFLNCCHKFPIHIYLLSMQERHTVYGVPFFVFL
nr:MAG TPA: hypothetical protein [Bacteriophage sp.]